MHTPVLVKRGLKVLAGALGVAVIFACGWAVSQVQNANRLPAHTIWVNNWVTEAGMLAGSARSTKLLTSEQTQSFVADSLYVDSLTLAKVYDTLPKDQQDQLLFWIHQARVIATKQYPDSIQDPRDLSAFVDCMQHIKTHDRSMRACMQKHKKSPASR